VAWDLLKIKISSLLYWFN